jgi:hypothetical protein
MHMHVCVWPHLADQLGGNKDADHLQLDYRTGQMHVTFSNTSWRVNIKPSVSRGSHTDDFCLNFETEIQSLNPKALNPDRCNG